jgi:hypothetical protein
MTPGSCGGSCSCSPTFATSCRPPDRTPSSSSIAALRSRRNGSPRSTTSACSKRSRPPTPQPELPPQREAMARGWTAPDDAQLARLYRAGIAVVEIAARLNRSEDAVNARRRQLALPARRAQAAWSDREDALLAAASRAGLPAWVVAERIGRPVGQIRWRRRALGLSAAPARRYSVGDDAAIRAAYTSSADLQELAGGSGAAPAHYGCGRQSSGCTGRTAARAGRTARTPRSATATTAA